MRQLAILTLLAFSLSTFSQTITISGNAFKYGQTKHDSIKIILARTVPSAYADTIITDATGLFSKQVPMGIYNIKFYDERYPFANNYFYQRNCYSNQYLENIYTYPKNGTLPKNNYYIGKSFALEANDTLKITAGSKLYFFENNEFKGGFKNKGVIQALGKENDSILITNYPNKTGGPIYWPDQYEYINNKRSTFSYCTFNAISISEYNTIGNSNFDVINSTFVNSSITMRPLSGNILIEKCKFSNLVTLSITNINISNGYCKYKNCEFKNGVYSSAQGKFDFINCLFFNTGLKSYIYNHPDFYLYNCIFTNIKNQTIIDNSTGKFVQINNCIFYNNKNSTAIQGNWTVHSSLFYGNGTNFSGTDVAIGKLIAINSNGDSIDKYFNVFAEPLFEDTTNFNFHPIPNSPVIDAGDNLSLVDDYDFDGNLRVIDGNYDDEYIVDIGPYEYQPSPLKITQQPQSHIAYLNENTTFSIKVTGQQPITYKWQHKGEDIANSNDTILKLTNLSLADTGAYRCIVSNGVATDTSTVAILYVSNLESNLHTLTVFNNNDTGIGSLRQALTDAVNGDTIIFKITGTIILISALDITKSITILGPGKELLTIDGNNLVRIFYDGAYAINKVKISRLSLKHARQQNYGAAIRCLGCDLTIDDCDISSNYADIGYGAGICMWSSGSKLTVINSSLHDNIAANGYGANIYIKDGGSVYIKNSSIYNNSGTAQGQALYISSSPSQTKRSDVIIENSSFYNNTTTGIAPCIKIENGGNIEITNSTIYGNSSGTAHGQAIYGLGGNYSFINVTIAGHNNGSNAIFINDYEDFMTPANNEVANVNFKNCIFDNKINNINYFSVGGGHATSNGYNISNNNSMASIFTNIGDHNNISSLLDPSGIKNNGGTTPTIALTCSSPAIDAGTDQGVPAIDQRGFARIGASDIGSFEYITSSSTMTVTTCDNYYFNGNILKVSGIYNDTLISAGGCDSLITLNLIINPVYISTNAVAICHGQNYNFNGHTYTKTGIYNDTLYSSKGCDSIIVTNLTVNPAYTSDNLVVYLGKDTTICLDSNLKITAIENENIKYLWNNGLKGNSITVYKAGVYSVKATNKFGCITTDTLVVSNYNPINITLNVVNSACGKNTGYASTMVSGGTAPYKYQWSQGDTLSIANNLAAGNYLITVTDAKGCQGIAPAMISTINGPVISAVQVTPVSCFGGRNGAVALTLTGGTKPYRLAWSNGDTLNQSISGLSAGPYEIEVTDRNKCVAAKSIEVSQPEKLTVSVATTKASCGNADGTAEATVTGGTAPYNYVWGNNAGTTPQIDGLSACVTNLTVTDNNNCQTVSIASVSEEGAANVSLDSVRNTYCNTSTGAIYISVADTSTYSYNWSNGSQNQDIENITPGNYNVEVMKGGCKAVVNATVLEVPPLYQPICLVTADSATGGNKIIWSRVQNSGIKQYNIYKETTRANLYFYIDSVPSEKMTWYIDKKSDSRRRSWRYKISAMSECGIESPLSNPHKTMHLNLNVGLDKAINLIWDAYNGFPTETYRIFRFTMGKKKGWELLEEIPSDLNSYTDLNAPNTQAFYQVVAVKPDPCYTNGNLKAGAGPFSDSYSNIQDNRLRYIVDTTTLINSQTNVSKFMIYPNPTTSAFTLEYYLASPGKTTIEVFDPIGNLIDVLYSGFDKVGYYKRHSDIGEPGVYMVRLTIGGQSYIKKIVVGE